MLLYYIKLSKMSTLYCTIHFFCTYPTFCTVESYGHPLHFLVKCTKLTKSELALRIPPSGLDSIMQRLCLMKTRCQLRLLCMRNIRWITFPSLKFIGNNREQCDSYKFTLFPISSISIFIKLLFHLCKHIFYPSGYIFF